MLSCLIIDDDPVFREVLSQLVRDDDRLSLYGAFENIIDAARPLQESKVQLLLLDIEMPEMSGMEYVRYHEVIPQVIFTTAHSEFAVEAFDFDVTDYLVKPITLERFRKAIDRAVKIEELNKLAVGEENVLHIKVGHELVGLVLDDIEYIQAFGDYIQIFTPTQKHTTLNTMNNIMNSLPKDRFMRIHRQYIVNLRKIQKLDGYNVHLNSGENLKVSRNLKPQLKEVLIH